MTDEHQLRARLREAVPEPPDSVAEAGPVVRKARQARRRVLTGTVIGAAASVALVASLAAVLSPDSVDPRPGEGPSLTRPAPDPYGTDPCPRLRLGQPVKAAPENLDLHSVRICAYDDEQTVPGDALVTDLSAFARRVADLPAANPARCAAMTPIAPQTALVLTAGDRTRSSFPIGYCSDLALGGRSVASERVQALVLAGVRQQRESLGVPGGLATPRASDLCGLDPTVAPVDPSRDTLVAGALCVRQTIKAGDAIRPFPLSEAGLAQVQEAWSTATRLAADQPQCQALGSRSLALVTAFGDVVHITDNGCTLTTAFTASSEPVYRVDIDRAELLRIPAKIGGDPQ